MRIARGISITNTSKPISTAPAYDADATAFFTAASITDTTQKNAVNTLVLNLKSANIWNKMKAIYPVVGGTAASHKWNLKDPRDLDAAFRLTFSTGWTHSSMGITPSNAYAETFANLSTMFTLYSAHYSYYIRNNTDTGVDIGVTQASPYNVEGWSAARAGGNAYGGFYNQDDACVKVLNSDSRGFYVSSVTSSTNTFLRKNNSTLGTTVAASSPANTTIYIGAAHIASPNSAANYSNHEYAFVSFGDGLTVTDSANLYLAVQTYQTTLGRQV